MLWSAQGPRVGPGFDKGRGTLRNLLKVALLFAVLTSSATPSHAEAEGPEAFRVVGVPAGHSLVLRSGPGLLYPIAGALPANSTGVKNLGCKGGLSLADWQRANPRERAASIERRWCHVRHGNVTGWARAKSLHEDEHPH
jgi:uncharacterized protein YraI